MLALLEARGLAGALAFAAVVSWDAGVAERPGCAGGCCACFAVVAAAPVTRDPAATCGSLVALTGVAVASFALAAGGVGAEVDAAVSTVGIGAVTGAVDVLSAVVAADGLSVAGALWRYANAPPTSARTTTAAPSPAMAPHGGRTGARIEVATAWWSTVAYTPGDVLSLCRAGAPAIDSCRAGCAGIVDPDRCAGPA